MIMGKYTLESLSLMRSFYTEYAFDGNLIYMQIIDIFTVHKKYKKCLYLSTGQ